MLEIQGLAHCACCCDAMGILSEDKLELIVIAAVSSAVTATMVGEVQAIFSGMLKHMHKVTFPVLAGFASSVNYCSCIKRKITKLRRALSCGSARGSSCSGYCSSYTAKPHGFSHSVWKREFAKSR